MSKITNISPIDGRYATTTEHLKDFFSEFALIKTRIEVEIEYIISLAELHLKGLKPFQENEKTILRNLYLNLTIEDAEYVKKLEAEINHDVKAIEYFIKEKCKAQKIDFNFEYIHFGLTSQDINNTSFPLMLKRYITGEYIPKLRLFIQTLDARSQEWRPISILAKTHGQPASPTTLGKELYVFVERLNHQLNILNQSVHSAKFGGATGNMNAHKVSFPEVDWISFAQIFVNKLGLVRQTTTTQIEHYDAMAALFDTMKRIQTILIDFSRDIWSYISFDVFSQVIKENEVGSSAMPHKVNPIDFENAEGNLMYSNAILEFLSAKLPISRLQRDLTDSTVLRNVGVPMAHFEVAIKSLNRGLGKLTVNHEAIQRELDNNWIVIAEAIQNVLRREGVQKPYELLKDFSRTNKKPSEQDFKAFIDLLNVSDEIKNELKLITPYNYIGYA